MISELRVLNSFTNTFIIVDGLMRFAKLACMADTTRIILGRLELILAVGSALAYTVACLILRFAQSRFIFFPSREIKITPEELNLPYQEVWLPVTTKTGKREQVHGWWIPSDSRSLKEERVILDCHGNGSNISANLKYAQQFHRMGLSIFLIDYRGYGRSTKRVPSETTVYQDVELAWNYLIYERGINPHNIFSLFQAPAMKRTSVMMICLRIKI